MPDQKLKKRYEAAIESFVDKVKKDPNVIAVIIYGSVSHGTVWKKSDIDTTVVVRDQKLDNKEYGIYEDGILLNVTLTQRSDFKREMEKSLTGSIGHSFGATSKVVYTSDESFYEYFEEYKQVGQADLEKVLFNQANWLLSIMEKIEKWLVVKNDPVYARYYVLKAADVVAQMEVCSHGKVPTREAILEAFELNAPLMEKFYRTPMSKDLSGEEILALVGEMEGYILAHMDAIRSVADAFFGDGEMKTGTHISRYFRSSMHGMHPILDFLCDQGILQKASQTIRLTPKGKLAVEEAAFLLMDN